MLPRSKLARSRLLFLKINRAEKHIEDLELASQAFIKSRPYDIRPEINPDTHERSYHLVDAREIPDEIVSICGDAIHNLRSALDHLAYQLVLVSGNIPDKRTCFPIADSAEEYTSPSFRRKIKGMRQDVINAIDAVHPYKGGNDLLWRLNQLDIIDKHRLLLAIESIHTAYSATPSERDEIFKIWSRSHPGEPLPNIDGILVTPKNIRILHAGDILRTIPESEVEQNMKFQLDIAFNEPPIIDTKSIVTTLHEMKKLVAKIIIEFSSILD